MLYELFKFMVSIILLTSHSISVQFPIIISFQLVFQIKYTCN